MNFTDIGGSGSPLAARGTSAPYTVLLIGGIIIGLSFACWVLLKILKKHKQSPAYIEKQKERTTTLKDVQALAKKINLTKQEASLLFSVCHREKAQNIYYTWSDTEKIDELFKKDYSYLRGKGTSEEDIEKLFKLRSRLERILSINKSISSSHNIYPGETLDFTVFAGIEYSFKIIKNEKDYLVLDIPQDFEKQEFCPKPLTKIMVSYTNEQKMKYVFATRVIRFQNGPNNTRQMVIQHASTVSMQSRRKYKRVSVGAECSFRAVEEIPGKKGSVTFKPKENKYQGTLVNISGGGCNIVTKLPIKQGQKIWLELELSEYGKIECCGIIVRMQQKTDVFSLHIAFLDISSKQRNNAFSYVYNYS